MKLVIISDTHCHQLPVPDGDVLIHCGDHTYEGKDGESKRAMDWLNSLPHKHKLFIAGNHEVGWQNPVQRRYILAHAPNCTYLHNSGVEIDGVKFWGSPYQPDYYNWAFQLPRGKPLRDHWATIPNDTDVLITHGPPAYILDSDDHFGDTDLLDRVMELKPKIHCFGHAHTGYGTMEKNGIKFINAAILDEHYDVAHLPIEIEL
jgi:predicted phosphodiesterase